MKLEPRRIEAFLRDPGDARVVLLFGVDVGLVRERALRLVRAVAGSADDPFRVVELERDGIPDIATEMASLPLTGGRRVVRLRDAGDAAVDAVQAVLAGRAQGFLVLEGAAGAGSALEAAGTGGTGAGRRRHRLLRAGRAAVGADDPGDPGRAGCGGRRRCVGVAGRAARGGPGSDPFRGREAGVVCRARRACGRDGGAACVGDLAGLSVDDALFAATAGDVAGADRALELAMAEGAAPVGVLRAALMHLQRLQRARLAVSGGATAGEAMKATRPPVFFKQQRLFSDALAAWSVVALEAACGRAWEAERACKRTGAPAETICRNAVVGLAQRGAAARRK